MSKLRIIFAGTPEFAVPCLNAVIASGHSIVGVWTQPDRPAGRGQKLTASAVKQRALEAGIPVNQPNSVKTLAAKKQIQDSAADLMIVVAYGLILPQSVLDMPKFGCWNVHGSILPRWRGAAPIQRAILAGDSETGVCLMQMQAGLDTGPVMLEKRTAIGANETAGHLHDRLAALGAEVITLGLKTLTKNHVLPAALPATPQSEIGLSYAHKIDKSEAQIDWNHSAQMIHNQVRAFSVWPIATANIAGEDVRIHAGEVVHSVDVAKPELNGEIIRANQAGIDVQCGDGAYRINRLQRQGGRVISAADFLNARQLLRR